MPWLNPRPARLPNGSSTPLAIDAEFDTTASKSIVVDIPPSYTRLFREVVVSRGMVAAVVRAFESGDVVRLRGSDGVVRDVRVVAVGGEVDDV